MSENLGLGQVKNLSSGVDQTKAELRTRLDDQNLGQGQCTLDLLNFCFVHTRHVKKHEKSVAKKIDLDIKLEL